MWSQGVCEQSERECMAERHRERERQRESEREIERKRDREIQKDIDRGLVWILFDSVTTSI